MDLQPIVRWAGGKWRLRKTLLAALPKDVEKRRHVEPFAGSLALWIARGAPSDSYLADACWPLINAYRAAGHEPTRNRMRALLRRHATKHSADYYGRMRARYNNRAGDSYAARAARFVYLNQAGYNGLWRTNARFELTTPYGGDERAQRVRLMPAALEALGPALAATIAVHADFRKVLPVCGEGDFVFLDPPYAPTTRTSFTAYGQRFGFEDHLELRDLAQRAVHRGAAVMVSNSDVPFVRDIYRRWRIRPVRSTRSIGGSGAQRGPVQELLITSY